MKMSPTEMGGHDNNLVYQTKKKQVLTDSILNIQTGLHGLYQQVGDVAKKVNDLHISVQARQWLPATAELQQELNDIMYSLEASIYFQLIIDLVCYELASNNIIVFVICTHESLVPCLQIQIDIRRLDLACKKCIAIVGLQLNV